MEITSLPYFHFPRSRQRWFLIYLLTIQWQAVEAKVTFNEMSFEQTVLHILLITNNNAKKEAEKWISVDSSSLHKRVIKWGNFNKTDFFCENNLSESNE